MNTVWVMPKLFPHQPQMWSRLYVGLSSGCHYMIMLGWSCANVRRGSCWCLNALFNLNYSSCNVLEKDKDRCTKMQKKPQHVAGDLCLNPQIRALASQAGPMNGFPDPNFIWNHRDTVPVWVDVKLCVLLFKLDGVKK